MFNLNEKTLNFELLRRQREDRLAASAGRGDALRHANREARLGNSFRQTLKGLLSRVFGGTLKADEGLEAAAAAIVTERDHAA